jgi:Uma2 family endonuclease
MATTTQLMTVEEFRRLSEDGRRYELRNGEAVEMTFPKFKHHLRQRRLRQLLEPMAPPGGYVDTNVAFRAVPEYDLREADVAYVSPERFAQIDPEDNLRGAPELVIEVLSPSNTVAEMNEKEQLCLENGSQEFWVLDQVQRRIKVSKPDGITVTYRPGQQIPLALFGGKTLAVDSIFE